jgi:hypothetical protein
MKTNSPWNSTDRKIDFCTEKPAIMLHEFQAHFLNNWKHAAVGQTPIRLFSRAGAFWGTAIGPIGPFGPSKHRAVTQTVRHKILVFQTIVSRNWFSSISLIFGNSSDFSQRDLVSAFHGRYSRFRWCHSLLNFWSCSHPMAFESRRDILVLAVLAIPEFLGLVVVFSRCFSYNSS